MIITVWIIIAWQGRVKPCVLTGFYVKGAVIWPELLVDEED